MLYLSQQTEQSILQNHRLFPLNFNLTQSRSSLKIFESLGFLFGLSIPLDLGLLAIPFSIISVIDLTNAFNMIDGFDGQAGLLSVIAIMGIFMFGLDKVDPDLYNFLTLFLSGLIAFLIFNFTNNIKM